MRTAMECNLGDPQFGLDAEIDGGGDLPPVFGGPYVDAPGVLVTAFHRESRYAARNLPDHFTSESPDAVRDPFVVRLVEYDGRPAELTLYSDLRTLLIPPDASKDARYRLGKFANWLTKTGRQWYEPDLAG